MTGLMWGKLGSDLGQSRDSRVGSSKGVVEAALWIQDFGPDYKLNS